MKNKLRLFIFISAFCVLLCAVKASGQTTAFTYQGKLTDNNAVANGNYDMQFALFDSAAGDTQIGASQTNTLVTVTNGIFTVNLDFGAAALNGADRFLQISVRQAGNPNPRVTLGPRQKITSSPYAVQSLNANLLGGIAANQYVQTNDSRLSDARIPLAGSNDYIQNTNSPQTADFNVSGSGTIGGNLAVAGTLSLNIVSAQSHYNIAGAKVFSAPNNGQGNTFIGIEAGESNTAYGNTFVGKSSGFRNSSGADNSFFGTSSGNDNRTGSYNSFFGHSAGSGNKFGNDNSFFGVSAGLQSETGSNNSFFGRLAGFGTLDGSNNTFIGYKAGENNSHGSSNTIVGYNANTVSGSLVFASAFGAEAIVNASDTIVIGKQAGVYNSVIRPADKIIIPGTLQIDTLGTTGGTPLCRNGGNRISACSASLLDENKFQDFSISIKNQQTQIERQAEQIRQQQILIEELKKLVCAANAKAAFCK